MKPVIHLDRPTQAAFTGWSGEVANYAGLPSAATVEGEFWMVLNPSGSRFLFTYKASGLYLSEGGAWRKINDAQLLLNDNQFSVYNSADNTKQIAFNVSTISTGTKRTATWPDKDGVVAMVSDIEANNELSEILANGDTTNDGQVIKALNGGGQLNLRGGADGVVCLTTDNEAFGVGKPFLKFIADIEMGIGYDLTTFVQMSDGQIVLNSVTTQANGKVIPDTDNAHDLGLNTQRWNTAHIRQTESDILKTIGGVGTQGEMSWDNNEETVQLVMNGTIGHLNHDLFYHVRNNTASIIPINTPVYASGTLGASGRITIAPMIADGSIEAKFFIGVTAEEIAINGDGKVAKFSKITNLDTSIWNDGDILYVSSTVAGQYQTTQPLAPNLKLPTALVIYSNPSNGIIQVRETQGVDLNEDHSVEVISPLDNDVLTWVDANQRWENKPSQGLIPQHTNASMLAIATPTAGDQVYNTTWGRVYTFDGDVWLTSQLVKATNQNAGVLAEGNPVIQDGTVANGVDLTSTIGSIAICGVVKDVYSGGGTGTFCTIAVSGEHNVLYAGAVSIGEGAINDNVAGQANGVNTGQSGMFGIARGSKGAPGTALILTWLTPTERF